MYLVHLGLFIRWQFFFFHVRISFLGEVLKSSRTEEPPKKSNAPLSIAARFVGSFPENQLFPETCSLNLKGIPMQDKNKHQVQIDACHEYGRNAHQCFSTRLLHLGALDLPPKRLIWIKIKLLLVPDEKYRVNNENLMKKK